MFDHLILHHYELSPYAEKIRLMLGLAQLPWGSVVSPEQPPRPNVDPLSGGYRRIPVAQRGADIFCDTFIIAQEVAALADRPELDPEHAAADANQVIDLAEGDVFFAAISSVPPLTLLGTMLRSFGPLGMLRFAYDRVGMMQGATVKPPQGAAARKVMKGFLETLEARLATQPFLAGSEPTLADFAAYHPLWLHLNTSRSELDSRFTGVADWYARVAAFGHGRREELTPAQAFSAAAGADPRPLPESESEPDPRLGHAVSIAPSDYGTVPVTGTLVATTPSRYVLRRDTETYGRLHVHFPRQHYVVADAAG